MKTTDFRCGCLLDTRDTLNRNLKAIQRRYFELVSGDGWN